ncbi:MAG: hypothetical protein EPO23_10845 [Xanthobacteraceae bacterium]|nr:MAG: hypothetical protein EPO23_10845 [Xanthobacteraceae bacterium]
MHKVSKSRLARSTVLATAAVLALTLFEPVAVKAATANPAKAPEVQKNLGVTEFSDHRMRKRHRHHRHYRRHAAVYLGLTAPYYCDPYDPYYAYNCDYGYTSFYGGPVFAAPFFRHHRHHAFFPRHHFGGPRHFGGIAGPRHFGGINMGGPRHFGGPVMGSFGRSMHVGGGGGFGGHAGFGGGGGGGGGHGGRIGR